MGPKNSSSSEIDQMVSKWKSGTIKFINKSGALVEYKGKPAQLLFILNEIRRDSRMKLAGKGLRKTLELKDVLENIWRFIKKPKNIPMHIRSKRNKFLYWLHSERNELRQIIKETCHFGPLDKGGDQ